MYKPLTIGCRYLLFFSLLFVFFGCNNLEEKDEKKNAKSFLLEVEKVPPTEAGYLQLLDSLRDISKKTKYEKGVAKSISLRAGYLASQNKLTEALTEYYEAIEVSKRSNDLFQLGEDYNNIGRMNFRLNNKEKSISAFKLAAEYRTKCKDSSGLGSSYNNIGFIYWQISNFDSAVLYFEKALAVRKKLPNKEFLATTYNNLGTIFYTWSLYDKALDNYLHALELHKQINNLNGVALTLCNIGLIYKETGQNEKAIDFYNESLPDAIKSNQYQTIGYVYSCLGAAYNTTNRDSALIYLNKSYEAYLTGKNSGGQILALLGLGKYYFKLNNLKSAKKYFTQMLELSIKERISLRIAESYKYLGDIALLENDLASSKQYYEKSITIADKLMLKVILKDANYGLSEIYEKKGDIQSALTFLKLYNKYLLEIENEGMQKKLLDLINKSQYDKYQESLRNQIYQNEKQKIYLLITIGAIFFLLVFAGTLYRLNSKRKKINLLLEEKNGLIESHTKEIEEKNKELLEINEAKEKIFSIVAHDLRSPFNTMINFTAILKEDYSDLSDNERMELISNLNETVIKTYELVENLLNLSASRTGKISFNPEVIELAKITDKTIALSNSQAIKKGIVIHNSVNPSCKVSADKNMLEIIIRNLVNNAIKYCNPNGQIEISTFGNDHTLFVAVEDNGIGMNEETVALIFNVNVIRSKRGTKGEKGTGLGLGLCKEFVEKHGGKIWVESELGKGSKFIFSIPTQKM